MTEGFVLKKEVDCYMIGNQAFHLTVGLNQSGLPSIQSLILSSQPYINWSHQYYPLAPILTVQQVDYSPQLGNMHFLRFEIVESKELEITYALSNAD